MAKLDVGAIAKGLDTVLDAVQKLGPLAGIAGMIAPVSTIVISAIQIGNNLLKRFEEGKEVLASNDKAKIEAILADLQAVNDRLNKAIEDS